MAHFALSAIGRDRPGIVAAVTAALAARGANLEDSQMAILQGHFTMMLVIATRDDTDVDGLRDELERVRDELELESLALSEIAELASSGRPTPSHVITVYGADHPGIVHGVAVALAHREATITDLRTELIGAESARAMYLMTLEVQAPDSLGTADLEAALGPARRDQAIEIAVHRLQAPGR